MNFINTLDTRLYVRLTLRLIREDHKLKQMHLNAMYDLMNRIYTDIVIQPARTENEHAAFCEMVDRYNGLEKTIFIVDRGCESYNNLAHVIEKWAFFLFRRKDIRY